MRMMSFAATTPQLEARTKTVTRRQGWRTLRVGDELIAIDKLPRTGRWRPLGIIRVVNVRREPLTRLVDDLPYGFDECRREGFPELHPEGFIERLVTLNPGLDRRAIVTRIQFTYAGDPCPRDTNGDGDCGDRWCPYCGEGHRAAYRAR